MKHLPNILTAGRLVLTLFMFLALAAAAGGVPWVSDQLTADTQFALQRWAFWAFVVAAVTDFFDGWLARRLGAETVWGAILDPIGDKVLVAGAILGLLMLGAELAVASWGAFGWDSNPAVLGNFTLLAHTLLWAATLVTIITGVQYWEAARKALSD